MRGSDLRAYSMSSVGIASKSEFGRSRPVAATGRAARRWLVFAGALAGAALIILAVGSALNSGVWGLLASGLDDESYIVVTVKSGDTLWSLAREHGPDHRDIRETIDRIRRINGLDQRVSLRPGEQLTIPIR